MSPLKKVLSSSLKHQGSINCHTVKLTEEVPETLPFCHLHFVLIIPLAQSEGRFLLYNNYLEIRCYFKSQRLKIKGKKDAQLGADIVTQ